MSNLFFTPGEIGDMRNTAESLMMDVCQICFRPMGSGDQDDYGHLPEAPGSGDWSADIQCSFDLKPGSKNFGADKTPLVWDAGVRLPHGIPTDNRGWIRIVERFQEPCAVVEYMVVGVEQEGPSATRLLLKRIEP
jgi:hypothetical protein